MQYVVCNYYQILYLIPFVGLYFPLVWEIFIQIVAFENLKGKQYHSFRTKQVPREN